MKLGEGLLRFQLELDEWARRLYFTKLAAKLLGFTTNSVLDLGSGAGSSVISYVKSKAPRTYTVACDISLDQIKRAKAKAAYDDSVQADARYIPFKQESFDAIVCLEVVEHLTREEGANLIRTAEFISKSKVILSTPVRMMLQDGSTQEPWQLHKSAWTPEDFSARGYQVMGVSDTFFIPGRRAFGPSKYLLSIGTVINYFLQPLHYKFPKTGFHMICLKVHE